MSDGSNKRRTPGPDPSEERWSRQRFNRICEQIRDALLPPNLDVHDDGRIELTLATDSGTFAGDCGSSDSASPSTRDRVAGGVRWLLRMAASPSTPDRSEILYEVVEFQADALAMDPSEATEGIFQQIRRHWGALNRLQRDTVSHVRQIATVLLTRSLASETDSSLGPVGLAKAESLAKRNVEFYLRRFARSKGRLAQSHYVLASGVLGRRVPSVREFLRKTANDSSMSEMVRCMALFRLDDLDEPLPPDADRVLSALANDEYDRDLLCDLPWDDLHLDDRLAKWQDPSEFDE